MKTITSLITLLISANVMASSPSCETQSYQETIMDYSGNCKGLILDAAKNAGCNVSELFSLDQKILAGKMSELRSGSTSFCKIESQRGHYIVLTDDMPEPPVATIYFSRFD